MGRALVFCTTTTSKVLGGMVVPMPLLCSEFEADASLLSVFGAPAIEYKHVVAVVVFAVVAVVVEGNNMMLHTTLSAHHTTSPPLAR